MVLSLLQFIHPFIDIFSIHYVNESFSISWQEK